MKDEFKTWDFNSSNHSLQLVIALFNGMCVMLGSARFIVIQKDDKFELHNLANYGNRNSQYGEVSIDQPECLFNWCERQRRLKFTYNGKPIFEEVNHLNIGSKLKNIDYPDCKFEVITGSLNGQGRYLFNVTQKYVCNYNAKDLQTLDTLNAAAGENSFFLA